MESTALLDKMIFVSNRDKAISVGENSKIFVKNSKFKDNKFGIASKDLSKAIIDNCEFDENQIQLSVYKKIGDMEILVLLRLKSQILLQKK